MDKIFKSSILKLVKLQSLVVKCQKMQVYVPVKFANFVCFCEVINFPCVIQKYT